MFFLPPRQLTALPHGQVFANVFAKAEERFLEAVSYGAARPVNTHLRCIPVRAGASDGAQSVRVLSLSVCSLHSQFQVGMGWSAPVTLSHAAYQYGRYDTHSDHATGH